MSNPNSNVTPLRPYPETPRFGDGGGNGGVMEARVAALEDGFKRIDTKLEAIAKDVSSIRVELAEVKGKVSNMPSTWQMVGICIGLIALVIASSGGLLTIIRHLQPPT